MQAEAPDKGIENIYICLPTLLKYMSLTEIISRLMPLNKKTRNLVCDENYMLFKQFIRHYCLNGRLKKADTPARADILVLARDNARIPREHQPENLTPFSYMTDGGTYNDDHYYFIQNIFSKSGICYSTKTAKDCHVQAYLGRKTQIEQKSIVPKKFRVKESDQYNLYIPFESFAVDEGEEETFKQLGELILHNQGWGYTCFISAVAIFVSEKEVKTNKSKVLQAFSAINTVEKFKQLDLPIKQTIDISDAGISNVAYEVDLS